MRGGEHASGSRRERRESETLPRSDGQNRFRGDFVHRGGEESILDRFFGPDPDVPIRVIR